MSKKSKANNTSSKNSSQSQNLIKAGNDDVAEGSREEVEKSLEHQNLK